MLDEPASGLDPEARHSLAVLCTRLAGEGMPLLVSSHILAELDEYSTHMLVMRQGRIIESKALGESVPGAHLVHVAFAREVPGLTQALGSIAGVRVVEAGASDATLEIAGDRGRQGEVLRELVLAGLPVSAFAEARENLHQSYLRTVARSGV